MKASKEFLKPDFTWKVPGKSQKGKYHEVGFSEKEGWSCACMYYQIHRQKKLCNHIKELREKIKYGKL